MGRKQSLEGRIELRGLEQVRPVPGVKGYLLGLANIFVPTTENNLNVIRVRSHDSNHAFIAYNER
jgi:hypothetical protein